MGVVGEERATPRRPARGRGRRGRRAAPIAAFGQRAELRPRRPVAGLDQNVDGDRPAPPPSGSAHDHDDAASPAPRRVIGVDDPADQRMADDVGGGEADLGDAGDAAEQADRLDQARRLAGRQVDLARIAGDDHLRVLAEAGEEHLHLHRRGVLRLVEDDDGVGQRAAAHEGERRHLDDRPTASPRSTLSAGIMS